MKAVIKHHPEGMKAIVTITTVIQGDGNPMIPKPLSDWGDGSGKVDGGNGDLWVPFGKGGGGNRDGGGDDVDPETLRETASITTAAIVTITITITIIIITTTSKSISTGGTRDASGWKARTSG